jgi:hypothetical protein
VPARRVDAASAVVGAVTLWPGKAWAATSVRTRVAMTELASSVLLRRRIRDIAASRALGVCRSISV